MKVDILLFAAARGGVENVINMTVPFLQKKGWKIRVIQLIWCQVRWAAEGVPLYPLSLIYGETDDEEELAQQYAMFLQENSAPQMVLAAGGPYLCHFAKRAACLAQKRLPVISWLHGSVSFYQEEGFGGYESLAMADGHLAISQDIYQDISRNCKNVPVCLIRNPIDSSEYKLKRCKNKSSDKKKLLFVGRLDKIKRIDIIIKAVSVVKDLWELHLIGAGTEAYIIEMRQMAEDYGTMESIRIYGWKDNPWDCVDDMDAFVMASDSEGFPLAAIEAQAHGLPVISTPVSGITELIKSGINGFLYPFGDWKRLAEILEAMALEKLPFISAQDCQEAVTCFRAEYALEDFEHKIKGLYYNKKLSVVFFCSNTEEHIEGCLQMLLRQKMPIKMLEFIFVCNPVFLNGESYQVLRTYEQRFPENILVIQCNDEINAEIAQNIGSQYASGQYVTFTELVDILCWLDPRQN